MRTLTTFELSRVSGGIASLSFASNGAVMDITDDSSFYAGSRINGHDINLIFYADSVTDLNGNIVASDLSGTFCGNGNTITPSAIAGGHQYVLTFGC